MSNDMDFFIIDLETLGIRPDAVVLSLAITGGHWGECTVDGLLEGGRQWFFNASEQYKKHGRTINQGTLNFWKTQDEAVYNSVFHPPEGKQSIKELYSLVRDYIGTHSVNPKTTMFLSRGPHFDFPIINNITDTFGFPELFNYSKVRDVRTMVDVFAGTVTGYVKGFEQQLVQEHGLDKHNALHDCVIDAMMIDYLVTLDNQ